MKKLLIIDIIISIICICVIILDFISFNNEEGVEVEINKTDTVINKVQIDSILLIINRKDSTIYEIKKKIKYEQDKASNLNDSSSYELFKRLVSE